MKFQPTAPSSGQAAPETSKPVSTARHVALAWSAEEEAGACMKVAFASHDRLLVDQHFGAAEGFVIYTLNPARAQLVGVIEFAREDMDGNENKLAARIAALQGCAAVYCLAVGGSAVRQLLTAGVQPIRLDACESIENLLESLRTAMASGGVAWIERAMRRPQDDERFKRMAEEGWQE